MHSPPDDSILVTRSEPKRRWRRLFAWLGSILAALLCVGCAALAILMDQTALAANVYLQAVNSNNKGLAMLLADHYTENAAGQRALYELDLDRDLALLSGVTLTNIETTREQTLSGQWVTILRFNWRPAGSNGAFVPWVLRVKTDRWFVVTYVRAVEVISP